MLHVVFTLSTDLAPTIVGVAASTAQIWKAVLFAVITYGSCWGDLKKPLDMLFDEKMEMWEEKQNECMNKGTQEDDQSLI